MPVLHVHGESAGTYSQNTCCQHGTPIPELTNDASSSSPPPQLITPPISHTYSQPQSSSPYPTSFSVSKRPDTRATLLEFLQDLNKQARAQSRAIKAHERDFEEFVESNKKRFAVLEKNANEYRDSQRNLKREVEHAVERQGQLVCRQGQGSHDAARDDNGAREEDRILVGLPLPPLKGYVEYELLVDVDHHDYELQQDQDIQKEIATSIFSKEDRSGIVLERERTISLTSVSEREYFTPPPFDDDVEDQEEILDFPSRNSYEYQLLVQTSPFGPASNVEAVFGTETMGAQALYNSLVQEAIDGEMVRLGGQNVLQEGESAVDFHMRKRLGRIERDLGQGEDWSFLDWPYNQQNGNGEDDNFSVPSYLSSGIETPPELDSDPTSNKQQLTGLIGERGTEDQGVEPLLSISMSRQSSAAETTASLRLRRERRGGSLIEDKLLAPSDGRPGKGAKWPRYSKNTIKARMSEIECDSCGGRVHFVCAGLDDSRDMRSEPWSCPECIEAILEQAQLEEEGEKFEPIPKAQRERCLRPKCIYRSYAKIVKKHKDDDEFFLERIIGRERVGRNVKGQYIYKYLVKWYDWEDFDSTWEPAGNIPDIDREEQLFLHAAAKADLDIHWKFIFLPEASMWFDEKGKYKIELLKQLGVEDRSWWYEH